MFEEEDTKRPYLPWEIFDELRNERNCRYADVETWPRMRVRLERSLFGGRTLPDPTIAGLCEEIDRSRFGDVLAYLTKKGVTSGSIPTPIPWLHRVPKIHYLPLCARRELQGSYTTLCGYGASYTSFTEALSKSIGELLERYVLLTPFFHQSNVVRRRKFTDKQIPHALLCETPCFFDWQRKHVTNGLTGAALKDDVLENAQAYCVQGESLSSGKRANIPLQHILWGPQYRAGTPLADTYRISPMTTSGGGAGFSLVEATLSGLCELLERDSFFIHWLNKLSPRRINIDGERAESFLPGFFDVYRTLVDRGYEVYFLDTTTDIRIPTVTSIVLEQLPDGRKSVRVSGRCHPDPARALALSLLEQVPPLNFSHQGEVAPPLGPSYVPFSDYQIGKSKRIDLWWSGSVASEIDFFLSGGGISFEKWAKGFPSAPADPKALLLIVLAEFARMEKEYGGAYEVFRYEVCHPLLDDLEYHVVKIIVPALMPLYLREPLAPLDSVRLRNVPAKLGFTPAPVDCYNSIPHPYP